jgi:hypothetical protein
MATTSPTAFLQSLPRSLILRPDPARLRAAAQDLGLEGAVSKGLDAPYRSGRRPEWVKVKTESWRVSNRERWRLFEKSGRSSVLNAPAAGHEVSSTPPAGRHQTVLRGSRQGRAAKEPTHQPFDPVPHRANPPPRHPCRNKPLAHCATDTESRSGDDGHIVGLNDRGCRYAATPRRLAPAAS